MVGCSKNLVSVSLVVVVVAVVVVPSTPKLFEKIQDRKQKKLSGAHLCLREALQAFPVTGAHPEQDHIYLATHFEQ